MKTELALGRTKAYCRRRPTATPRAKKGRRKWGKSPTTQRRQQLQKVTSYYGLGNVNSQHTNDGSSNKYNITHHTGSRSLWNRTYTTLHYTHA